MRAVCCCSTAWAPMPSSGSASRKCYPNIARAGCSAGSSAPFSVEDLAEDVVGVLDEAGIASAQVIGFSMGGVVAQALALAAPERITRLVLAATFATVNPQARLFLSALGANYRDGATAECMYGLIMPWLFSIPFLSDERAQPYMAYVKDPSDRQTREDWLHLLHALLAYDGRGRLSDIRVPTLVLYGDADCLASTCDAKALEQGIQGAVSAVVRGGHLMNIESREVFLGHILRFLLSQVVVNPQAVPVMSSPIGSVAPC